MSWEHQGHRHCDTCYDFHCRVPLGPLVSCALVGCHRGCGARLHRCKEEEHALLCPDQKVPCLNAHYGCPLAMARRRLARHLEVCPASVVGCSQDWNRWPISDGDAAFYGWFSGAPRDEADLDVAMALRDQEMLFRSIRMQSVFPELMEATTFPELQDMAVGGICPADGNGAMWGLDKMALNDSMMEEDEELSQEEREALAINRNVDIQNYSSWEGMFTKEMEGCKLSVRILEEQNKSTEEEVKDSSNSQTIADDSEKEKTVAQNSNGTGLAPWQDGVLERISRDLNVSDYNMYLVHNGGMLINFGQLTACTPREKDFVYGKLEPIEVQTIRSFNVPTSYRAKRDHVRAPSRKAKSACQVDTADLGVSVEDLPKSDEVTATLLCFLEKELRGHLISESAGADGFYVDVGTQTYDFASAPFKSGASLADVVAGRPESLHVHVQAESATRRHNKRTSAFNFLCGHFFRRNEYHSHYRNVHSDVQSCVNGWFEQRCPLAYLGCTFSQARFRPAGYDATVKYHRNLGTPSLRPSVCSSLLEGGRSLSPLRKRARNLDPLSRLPFEILRHLAGFLDSFTLSQLSQVSRLMREVCETLLPERGMVVLKWEKKTYSHGGISWKCRKKIWEFSRVFSTVDRWCFNSNPSMSEHLKSCPFYQTEERMRTEPVALVCLREAAQKKKVNVKARSVVKTVAAPTTPNWELYSDCEHIN